MTRKVEEVEVDETGHVVDRNIVIERPVRRGGGFGWGLMLGVAIIALAIAGFAYQQGSFQTAGTQADQATAQAEQTLRQTAETAGDAAQRAGDAVEDATDQSAAPSSDRPAG